MKNEKITVLVVDDDKRSQEVLLCHLKSIEDIDIIGITNNADETYKFLLERVPDLIFLDVEMPVESGFDLLNKIRPLKINPGIIFQTAFDKYAIQAIKHAAFDYLLKPIDKIELLESLIKFRNSRGQNSLEEKVKELISQIKPIEKIRFNTRTGFILINPHEIIYCQADWNYTEIWLGKEKKEIVTTNIGKVELMLPKKEFVRINRSTIINTTLIEKFDNKTKTIKLKTSFGSYDFKTTTETLRKLKDLFLSHGIQ